MTWYELAAFAAMGFSLGYAAAEALSIKLLPQPDLSQVEEEEPLFDIYLNPDLDWIDGDPEVDGEIIATLHEWLNSGQVGIGTDGLL